MDKLVLSEATLQEMIQFYLDEVMLAEAHSVQGIKVVFNSTVPEFQVTLEKLDTSLEPVNG